MSMLQSRPDKRNLKIEPIERKSFSKEVIAACKEQQALEYMSQEDAQQFFRTLRDVLCLALEAKGGLGIIVSPIQAFETMKARRIDFQAVDKDERHPHGYMTHRLKDLHVSSPEFMQALKE